MENAELNIPKLFDNFIRVNADMPNNSTMRYLWKLDFKTKTLKYYASTIAAKANIILFYIV